MSQEFRLSAFIYARCFGLIAIAQRGITKDCISHRLSATNKDRFHLLKSVYRTKVHHLLLLRSYF